MKVNTRLMCGPEEEYERLQGRLYMLLSRAIQKSAESGYQPPHWDHDPTMDEENAEKAYLEDCKEAAKEVERCAKEIYKILTSVSL
jgi:hypothetical protein